MKKYAVFGFMLVFVVSAVFVAGSALAKKPTPPPPGGGCLCPDVYAPVICSNGVVYSNLCQAGCAKATGCVPYGDATVQAAGGCICPKLYAPVVCDNGKTYPNQCLADCRNAKNCVPTGEL